MKRSLNPFKFFSKEKSETSQPIETSQHIKVPEPIEELETHEEIPPEELERLRMKEYTQEELFAMKWNALACAMRLYHVYKISPHEAEEGINILNRSTQVPANLRLMWECRSDYNDKPINGELLPDNKGILEMVVSWTEKDYFSKRDAEHIQIFGESLSS